MRVRAAALGLAVLLCAVPLLAQDYFIEAGDDVWNTPGGGGTHMVILGSQFATLCGAVNAPDTSVTFKGYNIPGLGTGDTVVTREDDADVSVLDDPVEVSVLLKKLSFRSTSTHPCSPNTIWMSESGTQTPGTMTITRTSGNGGTFGGTVNVSVAMVAKNSSGQVVGGTANARGSLNDSGSGTWAVGSGGAAWLPAGTCRFGNETAPSTHCYEPATTCPVVIGVGSTKGVRSKAVAQPEPCSIEAQPKEIN